MSEMEQTLHTMKQVLQLLKSTPELQGRKHIDLGIAFNKAIAHIERLEAQKMFVRKVGIDTLVPCDRNNIGAQRIFFQGDT